jgi:AraC-like DNA-binding protein
MPTTPCFDAQHATVNTALDQGFTSTDLPLSPPTLDAMARRLNLSTRTLSRRLTEAGTSYQDLIDEVRMRLSRELLQDGMRVGEIAHTPGYANTGSFDRAFRRWFGHAPSAHIGRA